MSSAQDGIMEIRDDDVCLLGEERHRLSALEREHKRVLSQNIEACRLYEEARKKSEETGEYKRKYEALLEERRVLAARNARMERLIHMCEGVDIMASAINCMEAACKEEQADLALRAIECLRGAHKGFKKGFKLFLKDELEACQVCKRTRRE